MSFYISDPPQMEKVEADLQELQSAIEKLTNEAGGSSGNLQLLILISGNENMATGKVKGDWIEYATPEGDKYWHNTSSGETSWEEPNI